MPIFSRPGGAAVYLEPLPEWRGRGLHDDEVARCTTLVLAFLEARGFTHRHIAQVVQSIAALIPADAPAGTARKFVAKRLERMRAEFARAGFDPSAGPQ